jgi:hypothetical protein
MNSIPSGFRILGVLALVLALGGFPVATLSQAQTAAPVASAAPSTFCGSQPLCYEANDFAATITDFRTSTSGYYKIIDVIVRFQNKTNHALILGYVAGSGTAMDDRGNRYAVGGGNAFRGIGQVYGTTFDPKFNIRAGGFGDAQFELIWAPGQTAYGLTFELNLTVDEINTIEGGQHTLGEESPLHYRGLANGVSAAAPGQATAFLPQGQGVASQGLPPCGPAGTTLAGVTNSANGQVPASANAAVSNATAAISSLGALFGKKKAAAPAAPSAAATSTASAAPCAPAAAAGGTSTAAGTSTAMGTSTATAGSPVNAAGTQTTGVASRTNAATTVPAAAMKTAATTPAKPAAAAAKAPAPIVNASKKTVVTPAPQKPVPAPANQ